MLALVHSVALTSVELDPADLDLGTWQSALWLDTLGGLVVGAGAGGLYLLKLDGSAIRLSKMPGGSNVWAGVGWHQAKNAPIVVSGGGGWRARHLPSTGPLTDSVENGVSGMVALPDRIVRFQAGRVYTGAYGALPGTIEKALSNQSTAGTNGAMLPAEARVPCERWWCAAPGDGRLRLYNTTSKLEERAVRVPSGFTAIGYSRKHDIFAVVRGSAGSYVLDVYANEPVAASMSAPALAPSARRGALSKASVTVLGADGEPCAGRVVTFAVTAGSVDPQAVETNASGVASTTYRAPSPAVAGVVLTATLLE